MESPPPPPQYCIVDLDTFCHKTHEYLPPPPSSSPNPPPPPQTQIGLWCWYHRYHISPFGDIYMTQMAHFSANLHLNSPNTWRNSTETNLHIRHKITSNFTPFFTVAQITLWGRSNRVHSASIGCSRGSQDKQENTQEHTQYISEHVTIMSHIYCRCSGYWYGTKTWFACYLLGCC